MSGSTRSCSCEAGSGADTASLGSATAATLGGETSPPPAWVPLFCTVCKEPHVRLTSARSALKYRMEYCHETRRWEARLIDLRKPT